MAQDAFGFVRIEMPREEVQRQLTLLHEREELLEIAGEGLDELLLLPVVTSIGRIKTAGRIAADLEQGEALLQMRGCRGVEFEVLFRRASPHRIVVRFIPYLPVFDIPLESVCPPFIVVTHDVLTDTRPFRWILRRIDIVGLDLVVILNRLAETEEDLHARVDDALEIAVRKREVVALRIILVSSEIREHIMDVHELSAPCAEGVMRAHERDVRVMHLPLHVIEPNRRVVDAVELLHRTRHLAEVDDHRREHRDNQRIHNLLLS